MTETNNALICQRGSEAKGSLNECVGVLRAYMYIIDSVGLVKALQGCAAVSQNLRGIFSSAAPSYWLTISREKLSGASRFGLRLNQRLYLFSFSNQR